jgi:hypothetical protein
MQGSENERSFDSRQSRSVARVAGGTSPRWAHAGKPVDHGVDAGRLSASKKARFGWKEVRLGTAVDRSSTANLMRGRIRLVANVCRSAPKLIELSPSFDLAFNVPACQGRRAPSHSMSPAVGYAAGSSFTYVGGYPPTLACHCLGIRRSNTPAAACRGQRVPFRGSQGGASGRRPMAGGMERKGSLWPRLAPVVERCRADHQGRQRAANGWLQMRPESGDRTRIPTQQGVQFDRRPSLQRARGGLTKHGDP